MIRRAAFIGALLAIALVVALIAAPSPPRLTPDEIARRATPVMLANCRPYLGDPRAYGDCLNAYFRAAVEGRQQGKW